MLLIRLPEIQADDQTLRHIAEKIGSGPDGIKQAGGLLLEKAARLKLRHTGSKSFELFQSIELLALGAQGKLSLWGAGSTLANCRNFWSSFCLRIDPSSWTASGQQ